LKRQFWDISYTLLRFPGILTVTHSLSVSLLAVGVCQCFFIFYGISPGSCLNPGYCIDLLGDVTFHNPMNSYNKSGVKHNTTKHTAKRGERERERERAGNNRSCVYAVIGSGCWVFNRSSERQKISVALLCKGTKQVCDGPFDLVLE